MSLIISAHLLEAIKLGTYKIVFSDFKSFELKNANFFPDVHDLRNPRKGSNTLVESHRCILFKSNERSEDSFLKLA